MVPWAGLPDVTYPEPDHSCAEALQRMIKHHANIIKVNPADDQLFDEALRCALTHLITNEVCPPPTDSDMGLRYLRDRISVPRDMSIYAAKRLKTSLETTAALVGDRQGPAIPVRHRRDQDPAQFCQGVTPHSSGGFRMQSHSAFSRIAGLSFSLIKSDQD